MSRTWKRLILIGLAVPNILSGCWAVLSPANWYENFPGWSPRLVSALPPFNEHLVSDSGSGLLATGLLVLIAGLCLRRDITVVATVGYLPSPCHTRSFTFNIPVKAYQLPKML